VALVELQNEFREHMQNLVASVFTEDIKEQVLQS
jgi:hypothetical protein